jgi:PhnB protein
MQLSPHLNFNGNCETAFKFYEKCLGAKITFMMPYEGSPLANEVPAEWRGKILHASLQVGDALILGADAPPGRYEKPQGFSVTLSPKDPAEAERIFVGLSESGTVTMPMQGTFWAARFGMLVDQFGIPWMINCQKAA